jgi:hypothetical protein
VGDFAGLWKNYKGAQGSQGLQGNAGTNGSNGAAAYVYIAYASDNAGTGFTTTFNSALNYIAIKATTSPIGSPSASDFAGLWKLYGSISISATAPITYSAGAIGINATNANTANYVVQRDSNGDFAARKIVLGTGNAADHLTLGSAATIGYNVDAVYFNTAISVPTIKLSTIHELRTAGGKTVLFDTASTLNAFEAQGNVLVVASLRLTGVTGVVKADGSGNVSGSATTDNLTEGATNLYYTAARVNSAADARIALQRGAVNGLASLDGSGKIPTGQIPSSLIGAANYQGTWNATTNTPALASGVGTKGYYYVVATAGATNLDGTTDWKLGDWAIFNGTTWDKVDNTDAVISVNGALGAVVLTTNEITENINLYYTDARVRACTLTGLSTATGGAIVAGDSILAAFGRAQNRLAAIESWTTTNVSEGTNLYYTDARVKVIAASGLNALIISPAASTSGSPSLLTVTGPAHTALTSGTEATDVYFGLARIVQFQTGALATQRAVRIDAPKYAFVAASVLTNAATVEISGAPIAWSNATITNAYGLRIAAGAVASSNTNAFGLYVEAPTSGTNNYGAVIATGNVGIGTAAPSALLDINSDTIRLRTARTPATAGAAGDGGDICWDGSYVYVCVAANTWKRAAIATW